MELSVEKQRMGEQPPIYTALSIAGSDSGGGAGIQADLKTFQELGVFGMSAITALTAQNTLGVNGISSIHPLFVKSQLEALYDDFTIGALKTGMLFSAEIIEVISDFLQQQALRQRPPIVVDPVMIAKGGASLLQTDAAEALKTQLLPLATVCTPNISEAEVLAGLTIQREGHIAEAASILLSYGMGAVVMKGGHWQDDDSDKVVDYVFLQNGTSFQLHAPRVATVHTHGTGCTFSAAITAQLAKGEELQQAIITAKSYVHAAISNPLELGHGHGPTNHFAYNSVGDGGEVVYVEG